MWGSQGNFLEEGVFELTSKLTGEREAGCTRQGYSQSNGSVVGGREADNNFCECRKS